MLWKGRRESSNVIDQRSFGAGKMSAGALILGAIVYFVMGGNPLVFLAQNVGAVGQQAPVSAEDQDRKSFASVVLADTENVWTSAFQNASANYRVPKLVLFRGAVQSACGRGSTASGPFYCPADEKIYLDLSFFDELSNRLGAAGDFAAAYVIAHEVGHHIQTVLGLEKGDRGDNQASVKTELQADCLAGAWAKQTPVGDDRLQSRQGGQVVPDSFTHGYSAQRLAAFKNGFAGGELSSCIN